MCGRRHQGTPVMLNRVNIQTGYPEPVLVEGKSYQTSSAGMYSLQHDFDGDRWRYVHSVEAQAEARFLMLS